MSEVFKTHNEFELR